MLMVEVILGCITVATIAVTAIVLKLCFKYWGGL